MEFSTFVYILILITPSHVIIWFIIKWLSIRVEKYENIITRVIDRYIADNSAHIDSGKLVSATPFIDRLSYFGTFIFGKYPNMATGIDYMLWSIMKFTNMDTRLSHDVGPPTPDMMTAPALSDYLRPIVPDVMPIVPDVVPFIPDIRPIIPDVRPSPISFDQSGALAVTPVIYDID